jgi:DNA-binding CsgD family transcriptional regulator
MAEQDPRKLLTEAQLACVRLVGLGSSKRIAPRLGISHNTVDEHLKEARRRLGVRSRHDAAELIRAWDERHPPESGTRTRDVVSRANGAMVTPLHADAGVPERVGSESLREDRALFVLRQQLQMPTLRGLASHWLGSSGGELTPAQRLRAVFRLTVAVAVVVLILVAVGESLNRTIAGLRL